MEAVVNDEYEETRRRAWRCLRRGAVFLACCVGIAEVANRMAFPLHHLLSESVTIAGWVALWKPIEMFLYDLPEMRRQQKKAQTALVAAR
jgi:hypothetical protein